MSLSRPIAATMAVGIAAVVGLTAFVNYGGAQNVQPNLLSDQTYVRGQVALSEVPDLAKQGYRTLISLRPDGEGIGQPSSAEMRAAATAAGMTFAYIPTPTSGIPDAAADQLAEVLAKSPRPALLYCRSGTRAARVWALAEASRKDGLAAAEITSSVSNAGRNADDLAARIETRISARPSTPEAPAQTFARE